MFKFQALVYRVMMGWLQLCYCVCGGFTRVQEKKNSAEELLTAEALHACLTLPGPLNQPSLTQAA